MQPDDTSSTRSEPAPHTLAFPPNAPIRPPSLELDEKQAELQPAEPASYVLTWTDDEIAKTRINSAAQLRTRLQQDGRSERQLFVLHGLPVDYLMVLREVSGIDDKFVEAHVGRRTPRRANKCKASWAHFDYPELVQQSNIPIAVDAGERPWTPPDLVGEPPSHKISSNGDGVIFCRASIWISEIGQILCVDRPVWASPVSGISKARYKTQASQSIPDENGVSMVTMAYDSDGNVTAVGDEIPSLETVLRVSLHDEWHDCEDMGDFLEELVLGQWSVFLDELGADLPFGAPEASALYWEIHNCLERNLNVSRQRAKLKVSPGSKFKGRPATEEWEALMARLIRRLQVLSQVMSTQKPEQQNANQEAPGGVTVVNPASSSQDAVDANGYDYGSTNNSSSQPDENRRSLDRVTYLGGIVVPFTVVSGILSIGDPWGPGGSKFWIFWVVSVPLTILTLLLIYADSIRKAEVWIEEASAGSGNSDPPTPQLEEAIPYSASMPVNRIAETISAPGRLDTESEMEDGDVPDTFVEKRWANYQNSDAANDARAKKWKKEELGWMGACATLFQVYKLKKGMPPGHPPYGRGRRPGGRGGRGPRRAATMNF
ncbi:hypothetical protein GGR57DRAFT_362003 [Xylariaceae sp. FL1272]|nr:hypothetical protein GGR57DRAFT_362003 [Xylariaceae sp. FL1272]